MNRAIQIAAAQNDLDFYTNCCDVLPRDGVLRSLSREAAGLLRDLGRQIDALVYDLYLPAPRLRQAGALTPAEIKIVEGAT